MGELYDKLTNYYHQDIYPFHMPGHKRNTEMMAVDNPVKIDITEIDGFDDLHHPSDLLKELMESAANIYKAKKTYFLVNGSTCGLLTAISSVTKYGDKILVARNCHKSVYHALYLRGLQPVYIYPTFINDFHINGVIDPCQVKKILRDNQGIKAIVITSPTYEGVVSDITSIAEIAHQYGIPLIVDEAHGAHFGLHEELPKSSLGLGADLVVQSLHKTLPSLTQTALLHVNSERISISTLERFLKIYQSSSPSYILLASIDHCINYINKVGNNLFKEYIQLVNKYRDKIAQLKYIRLFQGSLFEENVLQYDITKFVISVEGTSYNGKMLYEELLTKYHIQVEMASVDYIIALSSCFDKEEGFKKLYHALREIDKCLEKKDKELQIIASRNNEIIYTIAEALDKDSESIDVQEALGKICAEFLYIYPPGIPLLTPGELISQEIVDLCIYYKENNLQVHGLESGRIIIIKQENGE